MISLDRQKVPCGGWWYNSDFRVIPLPAQTPTRARLGSWSRQGQGRVRAKALQGIDNNKLKSDKIHWLIRESSR